MYLPTEVPTLEPLVRRLVPLLDAPAGPEHVVHLAVVAGFMVGQGMAPQQALAAVQQLEAQGAFPLAALAARGVYWTIPGPVAGAPGYYNARGPAVASRSLMSGGVSA